MFHTAPDPAKGEAEIMMEAETSSDATQGQDDQDLTSLLLVRAVDAKAVLPSHSGIAIFVKVDIL
jgi:hypothetical protein